MPRVVVLSPAAAEDLARVKEWYSQPGAGERARAKVQHILAAIRGLRERPTSFARGRVPGTRSLLVEEHRIVYRVENDTGDNETAGDVEIVRIWIPGRNRPARF